MDHVRGGELIYIYIYEPDTFWVNAPGNFIIYHKYTGKLLLYTLYIYTC